MPKVINTKNLFSAENQPQRRGRKKGVENSKTRYLRLLNISQRVTNELTGELDEFTILEQMDIQIIVKALKGDLKAYKEILDRTEGLPAKRLEINEPNQIEIIWSDPK